MTAEELAALLRLLARQAALIDRQQVELAALRQHISELEQEP